MLTSLFAYLDDEKDEKLLEDIFYGYAKQMHVLAESYLHSAADAEDAVSQVFEKIALKNFDIVRKIENEEDMRNYLLKATKNTALNLDGQKMQSVRFSGRCLRSDPCRDRRGFRRGSAGADLYQNGMSGRDRDHLQSGGQIQKRTVLPLRSGEKHPRNGKTFVSIRIRYQATIGKR